MITGYNTDIEHDGQVFHVQTEDRGVDNPLIESLIYTGGKIIAQKQYSYAWLLREGYSEESVQGIVDAQHRKMFRDIKGGKYDPEGPPPFGAGIITDRSLDTVILDFIKEGLTEEGVVVAIDDVPEPRPGELLVIKPTVTSNLTGKPARGAKVTIRACRADSDKSVVLFEGKTDKNGHVNAGIDLPQDFGGGVLTLHVKGLKGEESIAWEIASG